MGLRVPQVSQDARPKEREEQDGAGVEGLHRLPHQDDPAAALEREHRLADHGGSADGVDGEVQAPAMRRVPDGTGDVLGGVEREVRADRPCPFPGGLQGVHRHDERRAGHPGDLDRVGAEPPDPPDPDPLARANGASVDEGGVGRGDRVARDGGMFERHPGRDPGH